jgi:hypothetical protein
MIIILTTLIVLFCFIGAVVALLLVDSERYRLPRWNDRDGNMSRQRFHSHVEQGPDSLYPVGATKGSNASQTDHEMEKGG